MKFVKVDIFNDQTSTGYKSNLDSDYLYRIDVNRVFRKHDLSTMAVVASATVFSSSVQPTDLTLALGSAYIISSSARMCVVNLANMSFNDITTNMSASVSSVRGQQIAYNQAANLAIITRNANGGLTRVNANQTATSITLSHWAASGGVINCLISKAASTGIGYDPAWICGTAQGTILEVSSSMSVTKAFVLPSASTLSGSTTQQVTGISYWNPYLAVTTNLGLLYIFDYLAASAVTVLPVSNSATLCEASSGLCAIGLGTSKLGSRSVVMQPYALLNLETRNLIFNTKITGININTNFSRIYGNRIVYGHDTSTNSSYKTMVLTVDDRTITTEDTRIKEPQNTIDAALLPGRIIRILDEGIGQTGIVVDTNIGASIASLPARNSSNYIEIAISEDNTEWDIREFSK